MVISPATLLSDGTPQMQPEWYCCDVEHGLVHTEKGRQNYRNTTRWPVTQRSA